MGDHCRGTPKQDCCVPLGLSLGPPSQRAGCTEGPGSNGSSQYGGGQGKWGHSSGEQAPEVPLLFGSSSS